jgi:hypothetical protein
MHAINKARTKSTIGDVVILCIGVGRLSDSGLQSATRS